MGKSLFRDLLIRLQKEVWEMIRQFRGKRSVHITCLKSNNQIITDDRNKAQLLAQHYSNT